MECHSLWSPSCSISNWPDITVTLTDTNIVDNGLLGSMRTQVDSPSVCHHLKMSNR